jgi:hypothetical protein
MVYAVSICLFGSFKRQLRNAGVGEVATVAGASVMNVCNFVFKCMPAMPQPWRSLAPTCTARCACCRLQEAGDASPIVQWTGGKDFARGTNFTCMATSGAGHVVVGSRDGKIRMYSSKTLTQVRSMCKMHPFFVA